jgi:hypothetical protein
MIIILSKTLNLSRSNYFDVVFNYVTDIGFENSVNLFLPIITKMVRIC